MIFDPIYFLFIAPGLLFGAWASFRVKRTFKKFSGVGIARGLTGAEVARDMLRRNGIEDVEIEVHSGFLSDHYDPSARIVRLSNDVYHGRSVSSVGVAAHECGHVLQDAQNYAPMRVRQSLVGPANFGSSGAFIAIMAGMALNISGLVWFGVFAFSAVVLFQLVTLPVEFNASSRARVALRQSGVVSAAEDEDVGRVLNAAALTYVAALVSSVLQLAYFVMQASGSSDD